MRRFTWALLLAAVPLLAAGCGGEKGKTRPHDKDRPKSSSSDKVALRGQAAAGTIGSPG